MSLATSRSSEGWEEEREGSPYNTHSKLVCRVCYMAPRFLGAYIYPDNLLPRQATMEVQGRALSQKVILLPQDAGCCLSLLWQKVWFMDDLIQEADHPDSEITIDFKILWEDGHETLVVVTNFSEIL